MLFRNDKKDREDGPGGEVLRVPLLPLRDIIVFPHMVVPLFVGRQKSIKALEEAMNKQKFILLAAQREAKAKGSKTLAICNVVGSMVTREAAGTIYTHAGPEIGVASTKAFTAQLAAMFLFAVYLAEMRGTVSTDQARALLTELTRMPGKLESILARDEEIEDLAKEFSNDMKRSKGGDWGWMKRSDFKKEFSDPAFTLKKGEASNVILLPEGAFLLYAEDRKIAGIQPIDEVRDQIERILVQQSAREAQERWLERLRRNGYVKHY